MAEAYETLLRSTVGRAIDPLVVGKVVLHRLAGRLKGIEGRGTYRWDGCKWTKISDELIFFATSETERSIVLPEIEGIISDLYGLAKEGTDCNFIQATAEKLRSMLLDKYWRKNVCDYVVLYLKEEKTRRKPEEVLQTKGFLSVANGVIDLKSGELHEHSKMKDLFFTHTIQTSYNPNAQAPNFFKALDIWTYGNPEFIEYLQWALGRALTGQNVYDSFFWLHGAPKTRKELLLQIVADILEDYSMAVPHTVFAHNSPNKMLLSLLDGKRMVYSTDFEDGGIINKSSLVCFYEYDEIVVDYNSNRKVYNLSNLYIASSGYPHCVSGYASFRARVNPIMFQLHSQYHKLFDTTFVRKIMQEKEGILAWLVEGAKKYLNDMSVDDKTLPFSDLAKDMKTLWIEQVEKGLSEYEQNKKPLPTRKGQTNSKNRQ